MERKPLNKRFGKKIRNLYELIFETPEWEDYVTEETANIVKYMYEVQSFKIAEENLKIPSVTIRAHLLRALERIQNKNTEFKHGGKSKLAQELFTLMDTNPGWENYVTEYEAMLAKSFREVKNFRKLSDMLGLTKGEVSGAGNIAGTLYGTTQKVGVIGKIKEGIPQSERRDFSIFDSYAQINETNNNSDKNESKLSDTI